MPVRAGIVPGKAPLNVAENTGTSTRRDHRNAYKKNNRIQGRKQVTKQLAGNKKHPVYFTIHVKTSFEEVIRVVKCLGRKCYYDKDIVIWRVDKKYTPFFEITKEYYKGKKYARIKATKFAYKNNDPSTKRLKPEAIADLTRMVLKLIDEGYEIVKMPEGRLY